jgi:hypothetical protein
MAEKAKRIFYTGDPFESNADADDHITAFVVNRRLPNGNYEIEVLQDPNTGSYLYPVSKKKGVIVVGEPKPSVSIFGGRRRSMRKGRSGKKRSSKKHSGKKHSGKKSSSQRRRNHPTRRH